MKTALLFFPSDDPAGRRSYPIGDETTVCDGLPEPEFGDAVLLSTGRYGEILFSPDPKIVLHQQGLRLAGEALFCDLDPDAAELWAAAAGTRRLHVHEMAALQSRGGMTGALPQTLSGSLARPMLAATSIRARTSQLGQQAILTVQRGTVTLLRWFDPLDGQHSVS